MRFWDTAIAAGWLAILITFGVLVTFTVGCSSVTGPTQIICVQRTDVTGHVYYLPAPGSPMFGPDGKVACTERNQP